MALPTIRRILPTQRLRAGLDTRPVLRQSSPDTVGGGHGMDTQPSSYFFVLAQLSIAFVGFGAIVAALRQGLGRQFSKLQILITRLFIEFGLVAVAFSMLAPTLALTGMRSELVWRTTSAIMFVVLLPYIVAFPIRRLAATEDGKLPLRVPVVCILGIGVVALQLLNLMGWITPGPTAPMIATIYVLQFMSVAFISTYTSFLRD
jgi:hypothetical protein